MQGQSYRDNYYCRICRKYYKKEAVEFHQSKKQRYPVCPRCPQKWHLRKSAHNKRWKNYIEKSRISMIPILSKREQPSQQQQ